MLDNNYHIIFYIGKASDNIANITSGSAKLFEVVSEQQYYHLFWRYTLSIYLALYL